MAISTSVADINAFTNQYIVPRMVDTVYKPSPLFSMMLNRKKVYFRGGKQIQVPLMYGKLNGGWFSKSHSFNTEYVQTDAAFVVNMKYAYVNVSLYGTDQVLNRGKEAAFSNVESKMANASMRMAEILATSFYGDGQSTAADVTTSSNVLSTSESFDGLLAWIDDGNDYSTYSTATDVTKSFAAIGGITRSDMFASAPSFTGATTPAAGLGGINSYTDRAFTTFQLSTVNKALGQAWFSNVYPDLFLVQQAGWNKFWNATQPNQRFMDEDTAKIGFKGLRFNGLSNIVVDKHMPEQLLLGVNTDGLELYISDVPLFQFGFTGFKEVTNTINYAGQFIFGGAMIVNSPRSCFKLVGAALA